MATTIHNAIVKRKPQTALIFYDGMEYIEIHEIKDNKLLQGYPLSIETYAKLFRKSIEVNNETYLSFEGIIPNNILYAKHDIGTLKIAWLRFPKPMKITLEGYDSVYASGNVNMPTLLFLFNGSAIKVFALKGQKRPSDDAKIYNLNIWNVSSGSVCMGQYNFGKLKSKSFEKRIQEIETAFSMTSFTPDSDQGPVYKKWKKLIGTNKPFDYSLLTETKTTLNENLKEFIRS